MFYQKITFNIGYVFEFIFSIKIENTMFIFQFIKRFDKLFIVFIVVVIKLNFILAGIF